MSGTAKVLPTTPETSCAEGSSIAGDSADALLASLRAGVRREILLADLRREPLTRVQAMERLGRSLPAGNIAEAVVLGLAKDEVLVMSLLRGRFHHDWAECVRALRKAGVTSPTLLDRALLAAGLPRRTRLAMLGLVGRVPSRAARGVTT